MKQIYLYPLRKKVDVPDKVHSMLCVYKIFWPPEATIQLGKKKMLRMKDFTPWPPPEQSSMDFGEEVKMG